MNIFYLNSNPVICAQEHCDKHVVKMILETAQLLSTAHRILDGSESTVKKNTNGKLRNVKRWKLPSDFLDEHLYQATHINHPSAVWARESTQNYIWLANLLISLCEEYTFRYNKMHKIESTGMCYILLKNVPTGINKVDATEPPQAMPDDCKVAGNPIQAYRNYYIQHKARFARWTKRKMPEWWSYDRTVQGTGD